MIPLAILAGGLGTRLGLLARGRPKALVNVHGLPFLDYQLHWAARQGIRRVVMCVGYGSLQIRRHLEARRPRGIDICFSDEGSRPRGTAAALRRALPMLGSRFLVLYGDSYLPVRYAALERAHRRLGFPALMAVYRNTGRFDRSNVAPAGRRVGRYVAGGERGLSWVDAGLAVLAPIVLAGAPEKGLAELYTRLAAEGRLGCWRTRHRFWEVGSPGGLTGFRRRARRLRVPGFPVGQAGW